MSVTSKKLFYLPNTFAEVRQTNYGYYYSDIFEKYKDANTRNFNIVRVDLLTTFILDTLAISRDASSYDDIRELYVQAITGQLGDMHLISKVFITYFNTMKRFREYMNNMCLFNKDVEELSLLGGIQYEYNKAIQKADRELKDFCYSREYKVLDHSQGYAYVAVPSYVYSIEVPEKYIMEVVSNAQGREIVYCGTDVCGQSIRRRRTV